MARIFIVLALFLCSFSLQACDVCGCSLSGGGIGLLSIYGQNTIGIRLHTLGFQGNVEQGKHYIDQFTAAEVYARYQFSQRWSFSVFQSYRWNSRTQAEEPLLVEKGFGDTRLFANYAILNNRMIGDEKWLHWELRLGGLLPTGKFNPQLFEADLPDNFNPGRGAFGWMVQSGLVFSFGKWGMSWDLNGQAYFPTKTGYQFGEEWSTALLLFRELGLGTDTSLKPFLGTQAEVIGINRYVTGNAVHGTGGRGAYGNAGFQLQHKRWMFSASVLLPLYAKYSDQEVIPNLRMNAQVNFLF